MEPIEFLNYEKISDDLFYISPNCVLRFNVGLAAYNKEGKRVFFHKEYEYQKERRNVVTIRRNYDYYLTIETFMPKESIMIRPKDFPKFKMAIKVALSWFQDKKYSKLYATNRGKLIMTSPIPTCEINDLPAGKYLKFDPVIIDNGIAKDDKQPGVSITIADPNNYVNISVDNLIGLDYIVSCINMVLMAQSMINSIPLDHRINRVNLSGSTKEYINNNHKDIPKPKTIEGRFIGGKTSLEDL